MGRVVEGLQEALKSAQCTHAFEWVREHRMGNGVVGYCPLCRCRYTAWPGTPHYDEIQLARDSPSRPPSVTSVKI